MASVRQLKKEVNNMIFDVVEECYSIQLYNPSKKAETEAFIDEAADYMNSTLTAINAAKTKADYKKIIADAEATAEKWVERLNTIQ